MSRRGLGARDPRPFWERKTLREMTEAEWESLCDRCGRCCLHRFELEAPALDRPAVVETDLACKLLDCASATCTNYPERKKHVPDCWKLSPEVVETSDWLPDTCAYKLVHEGSGLRWWHPLVSGDPDSVRRAGISVAGYARPEASVRDQDVYFQEWTNAIDARDVDTGGTGAVLGGGRRDLRRPAAAAAGGGRPPRR